MQLTATEAMKLVVDILTRHGMSEEHARIVGDHLIDAAVAGYEFASLPRIFPVVERLKRKLPSGSIRVVKEDDRSALIDGGGHVGYVVTLIAVDKAIELCKRNGVAIVGANNTWFSGRLAYYVERAAAQGFIALHTANTTAMVAPFGGVDKVLGTNPFAVAIPSDDGPLVVDFGTSATTWGEILLRQRTAQPLPKGWAVDADGNPTTDPTAALTGAILTWGGHRGYGLSLVAQALGILAGSDPVLGDIDNFGLFFFVFDPTLLMPIDEFKARMGELKRRVKASRTQPGVTDIRIPGEASQRRRAANPDRVIHVDDKVYQDLLALL